MLKSEKKKNKHIEEDLKGKSKMTTSSFQYGPLSNLHRGGSEKNYTKRPVNTTSLVNSKIRPFTSSETNLNHIRRSYDRSRHEEEDVETELKRIEDKLERRNLNHIK